MAYMLNDLRERKELLERHGLGPIGERVGAMNVGRHVLVWRKADQRHGERSQRNVAGSIRIVAIELELAHAMLQTRNHLREALERDLALLLLLGVASKEQREPHALVDLLGLRVACHRQHRRLRAHDLHHALELVKVDGAARVLVEHAEGDLEVALRNAEQRDEERVLGERDQAVAINVGHLEELGRAQLASLAARIVVVRQHGVHKVAQRHELLAVLGDARERPKDLLGRAQTADAVGVVAGNTLAPIDILRADERTRSECETATVYGGRSLGYLGGSRRLHCGCRLLLCLVSTTKQHQRSSTSECRSQ